MYRLFGLILSLIMLAVCSANAAPNLINYQGTLTDNLGVPVTNATQAMTFRLFDAETAGTLLWEELRTVDVQNGSYNLLLGSVSALNPATFAGESLWLEVVVDAEVLGGRQRLVSVPYALQATTAQSVVDGSGSGLDADLLDGQDGSFYSDWSNLTNVPAGIADGDQDTTYVSGTGLNLIGSTFSLNVPLALSGSEAAQIISVTNYDNTNGRGIFANATGSAGVGVFGYASATGDVTNYGGDFRVGGANGIAVSGAADALGPGFAIGGDFRSQTDSGIGVRSTAIGINGTGVYATATAYGGRFSVSGDTGYAVYGRSSGASGFGVYGWSEGASGYGIYGVNTGGGYAGYFNGDVTVVGNGVISGDGSGLTNLNWNNLTNVPSGAGSGLDSDLLDGQQGSYYLDWTNLTSVPAGLADGDQDTTYTNGVGLDLNGTTFSVAVPLFFNGDLGSGVVHATNATGRGVSGWSSGDTGAGVFGNATATGATRNLGGDFRASGTYGVGVSGSAGAVGPGSNIGGEFHASADSGRGVYAYAPGSSGQGVYGLGGAYGGAFSAVNNDGRGVSGQSDGTSGYGVYGKSSGASGYGVYGINTAGGYAGYFSGNVHLTGVLSGDGSGLTNLPDGVGSGLDADLLDGQQGIFYSNWLNLTNVPAGFADGVDNDTNTTYAAGTGLTLSGTTFSVNPALIQSRVSGSCAAGSSIRAIGSSGTVTCEADTDTNTTYNAGSGLIRSGTTFSVLTGGINQTHIATDGVAAAEIAANAVGASEIASNAVARAELNGTEVSIYQVVSPCDNPGNLSASSTCTPTTACSTVPLRFYTCASVCNSTVPVSCPNTMIGYLLSPSMP